MDSKWTVTVEDSMVQPLFLMMRTCFVEIVQNDDGIILLQKNSHVYSTGVVIV